MEEERTEKRKGQEKRERKERSYLLMHFENLALLC